MARRALAFIPLLLLASAAFAQTAGEPCDELGKIIVRPDRKSLLTCVSAGKDASQIALRLIWTVVDIDSQAWPPNNEKETDPFSADGHAE